MRIKMGPQALMAITEGTLFFMNGIKTVRRSMKWEHLRKLFIR